MFKRFSGLVSFVFCLTLAVAAGSGAHARSTQMVKVTTSLGEFVIELDAEKAPVTVENLLNYVNAGFYDGTIFHRVIPGFVVQGGGMEPGLNQKSTNDPIENEADNGLKNLTGTLSMARTNDPHSATSQFFINVNDNAFLDHTGKNAQGWGYAVFGKIVEGMDVVNQMVGVATGNVGPYGDVPKEDIVLIKAEATE